MVFRLTFILCLFITSDAQAGAWTLKQGNFWSKIAFLAQSAQEEYVAAGGSGREPDPARIYEPGERARYRENGQYTSRAVFLDLYYGITDRIDLGLQIPFFNQTFENVGFRPPNTASGISDIRAFVKINLIQNPVVGTFTFGAKAPTGKFKAQDGLIPVGEGQWDFDFIAQIGRSLYPLPAYANLDIGYRLRLKNEAISRNPGNEWFFTAEAGYQVISRLMIALKVEGIRGKPATVFDIRLPREVKRITYVAPTLFIGPYQNFSLETAIRISAGGRNFPAGTMWIIGLSHTLAR